MCAPSYKLAYNLQTPSIAIVYSVSIMKHTYWSYFHQVSYRLGAISLIVLSAKLQSTFVENRLAIYTVLALYQLSVSFNPIYGRVTTFITIYNNHL